MNHSIGFNKPYYTGKEAEYIQQSIASGKISGDGVFTKKCHDFFEKKYGFKKTLLTTSCTDALEMCAILLDIKPGDEIIIPSYTFVSTVNPFLLRGATIVFADSRADHPGIDEDKIEQLITSKTKAIVVVHYAGLACDMDKIMAIASKNNLFVVEDAAQAIDAFYITKDGIQKPLGGIGHLGTFSFHDTKNITCGEGGLLIINDDRFVERAEIIREKGTNRSKFFRGEIDKYGWVDIGSSFLLSDILAAFLYAQLEQLEKIQNRRKEIWERYYKGLKDKAKIQFVPNNSTNNAQMFYVLTKDLKERNELMMFLKNKGIQTAFHYQSLHQSPFFKDKYEGEELPNANRYSDTLLRLPMFVELTNEQVDEVIHQVLEFYKTI